MRTEFDDMKDFAAAAFLSDVTPSQLVSSKDVELILRIGDAAGLDEQRTRGAAASLLKRYADMRREGERESGVTWIRRSARLQRRRPALRHPQHNSVHANGHQVGPARRLALLGDSTTARALEARLLRGLRDAERVKWIESETQTLHGAHIT